MEGSANNPTLERNPMLTALIQANPVAGACIIVAGIVAAVIIIVFWLD